eukprot:scaffold60864_cov35-Attheya_sp.AAC.1
MKWLSSFSRTAVTIKVSFRSNVSFLMHFITPGASNGFHWFGHSLFIIVDSNGTLIRRVGVQLRGFHHDGKLLFPRQRIDADAYVKYHHDGYHDDDDRGVGGVVRDGVDDDDDDCSRRGVPRERRSS